MFKPHESDKMNDCCDIPLLESKVCHSSGNARVALVRRTMVVCVPAKVMAPILLAIYMPVQGFPWPMPVFNHYM